MRYSQNAEQEWIERHFNGLTRGRFLDIGAFDGLTFSNVRRLLEIGWTGVCVEPAPAILPRLHENLLPFPGQVSVVPCAIGTERKTVTFYDSNGDGISTSVVAHKEKWERGKKRVKYTETEVDQITPEDLILRHGDEYDFINIDTESTNVDVCRAMPWERLTRCKLVCIEHDSRDGEILARLAPLGFTELHRNAENLILRR